METNSSVEPSSKIINSRVFDFPREAVFAAFKIPAVLATWFGPNGFTSTFSEFDFKPGGFWRFVLHGPDGKDYPNENRFVEVVEPELIRYEHIQASHNFTMTMKYADESGKTRLTWIMDFESADEANQIRDFVNVANEQNFDRLEEALQKMT